MGFQFDYLSLHFKELALSFFAVLIVLLMIIIGGRLIKTLAWAAAGKCPLAWCCWRCCINCRPFRKLLSLCRFLSPF